MLLEHNGFFLADVVGLGKTVVAAMIAKRFMIANGSLNTCFRGYVGVIKIVLHYNKFVD
jgi:hypothetical protein